MSLVAELERETAYADVMAGAAKMWMERAKLAERKLAVVVHAAGDEVRVLPHHNEAAPDLELVTMEYPEDMSIRLRTRVRKGNTNG